MTWFYVDDHLSFHRKTITAGNAAMGLWVRAGSWCAADPKNEDGHVPMTMVRQLGTKGQADKLVAAGLWIATDGGYQFHDWGGWQPSKTEVEERKRKRAEAGHRGGVKSGETRRSNASSKNEASASSKNEPSPVPSSPVPHGPVSQSLQVVGIDPSDDDIRTWQTNHPGVDLDREAVAFVAYNPNPAELAKPRAAWHAWLKKAQRTTPGPPKLHALCSEHARDSRTCPWCAEEAS